MLSESRRRLHSGEDSFLLGQLTGRENVFTSLSFMHIDPGLVLCFVRLWPVRADPSFMGKCSTSLHSRSSAAAVASYLA